jgi:hypothetical protein
MTRVRDLLDDPTLASLRDLGTVIEEALDQGVVTLKGSVETSYLPHSEELYAALDHYFEISVVLPGAEPKEFGRYAKAYGDRIEFLTEVLTNPQRHGIDGKYAAAAIEEMYVLTHVYFPFGGQDPIPGLGEVIENYFTNAELEIQCSVKTAADMQGRLGCHINVAEFIPDSAAWDVMVEATDSIYQNLRTQRRRVIEQFGYGSILMGKKPTMTFEEIQTASERFVQERINALE